MIRVAEPSDRPEIERLAREWASALPQAARFPVDDARIGRLFEALLAQPNGLVLVADGTDGLEGVAAVTVAAHPMLAMDVGVVVAWFVSDVRRGRLGVTLLKRVARWAVAHGADVVQVSVPALSTRAGEVCRAMGFTTGEQSWTRGGF